MDHPGRLRVFRLLLLAWLTVRPAPARVRHALPVLWMRPVSSRTENRTAGVVRAVRLALEDLQKQPAPLGNYEVQLQLLDSQCDFAETLKVLFDAMWAGPRYLLVFGGACPPVTALVARALPALHLVQVSFEAPPPGLPNRKLSGNLFSTAPSDRVLNQAVLKLLQRYRWTRVGVVTQDAPGLSEVRRDLLLQLQRAHVEPVTAAGSPEDSCSGLRRLKDLDVRIIVAQVEDEDASEVFCCASGLDLLGPRYQWVVAGGAVGGWRSCEAGGLLEAADGTFWLQVRPPSRTGAAGVSGQTLQDYQNQVPLHAFAYDAVWVAAMALSQLTEAVKLRQKYGSGRSQEVSEEEELKMLQEVLRRTRFQGITGPVSFRHGERMLLIDLVQFQGNSSVLVGGFNTSTQQLRVLTHLLKFKGPGPARDPVGAHLHLPPVSLLLYVVMSSSAAATIFITLTIFCLLFINQRRTLIAGSASQDLLLLLGVLLCSSSVPMSGLDGASLPDRTVRIFHSARLWTLTVGHSLGFAVLLTRTWRTYSRCVLTQKTRLPGTGPVLFWILLLDVLVLTSWEILDPLRREEIQHRPEVDPADVPPSPRPCSSVPGAPWITAACSCKAPLLGLGCFLAWNVWTADCAPAAKRRSVGVFAAAAFSVSGVSGSLLTSHNPPVQFCVSSVLVLSCSVFILILFGPQMVQARRGSSELQRPQLREPAEDELRRLNQQLQSQNQQLDVQIETIRVELSAELRPPATAAPRSRPDGAVLVVHEAEVRARSGNCEDVNSPEQ